MLKTLKARFEKNMSRHNGSFDTKTWSWLKTPANIRKLRGSLRI